MAPFEAQSKAPSKNMIGKMGLLGLLVVLGLWWGPQGSQMWLGNGHVLSMFLKTSENRSGLGSAKPKEMEKLDRLP